MNREACVDGTTRPNLLRTFELDDPSHNAPEPDGISRSPDLETLKL